MGRSRLGARLGKGKSTGSQSASVASRLTPSRYPSAAGDFFAEMVHFVDPRIKIAHRPNGGAPRCMATTGQQLAELHCLCRAGRLYDVERWTCEGHPLQVQRGTVVSTRHSTSALQIALAAGNQALSLLLLCNGYDPNLDAGCPLDIAFRSRRWDLVDLLLDWGTDPHRANLSDLFETYNSDLVERFYRLGVDVTAGHELAAALGYHTSNKPLFGFAKRHREHDVKIQKELNTALVHHAGEGNEKGVQLCLWAGADPHSSAPRLDYPNDVDGDGEAADEDRFAGFTAVEVASRHGHVRILERLRPDPSRDDFEDLYRAAESEWVVEFLARTVLPRGVGAVISSQLRWLDSPLGGRRSLNPIKRLFEVGGRWKTSTPEEVAEVRRSLLKLSDRTFVEALKLLATNDYCTSDILAELGRTPSMRGRMKKVGFFPAAVDDPHDLYSVRPTRSREVLSRFGVALPKRPAHIPHRVEIGFRGRDGRNTRTRRIDRAALFDRVWSEPMRRLAARWGLSDRGLAKVCGRLQVPVPPRGYWAKAQAGRRVRRPRLPALLLGEDVEIVIHELEEAAPQHRGPHVAP